MAAALLAMVVLLVVLVVFLVAAGQRKAAGVAAVAAAAAAAAGLWAKSADYHGGGEAAEIAFHGEHLLPDEAAAVEKALKVPIEERKPLREMPSNAPRLPWRSGRYKVHTALHAGQRKLLMSEVDFLTRHGDKAKTVVYAGAAAGTHIKLLSELFPVHVFYLYDPAKFSNKLDGLDRVHVHRQLFTEETARTWANTKCLFLSDIRSGTAKMTKEAFEERVLADAAMQKEWVEIVKPEASLLKFRMPFVGTAELEYLDGTLRMQPWAPATSTELRLEVLRGAKPKTYALEKYEQGMSYHNAVNREWLAYTSPLQVGVVKKVPGADFCYDCNLETSIWRDYLRSKGVAGPLVTEVVSLYKRTTKELGQCLTAPPHGVKPHVPMVEKRPAFVAACKAEVCKPRRRCRSKRQDRAKKRRPKRQDRSKRQDRAKKRRPKQR